MEDENSDQMGPSQPKKQKTTAAAEAATGAATVNQGRAIKSRQHIRDYVTPVQRRQLLKRALDDVVTYGISVRLAAESHGVAKSSLADYIRRQNIRLPNRHSSASSAASAYSAAAASLAASLSPPAGPAAVASASAASFSVEQWRQNGLPTLVPWQSTSASWSAPATAAASSAQASVDQTDSKDLRQRPSTSATVSELLGSARVCGNPCRLATEIVVKQEQEVGDMSLSPSYNDGYVGVRGDSCYMTSSVTSVPAGAAAAWKTADMSQQLCNFINRSPSPFHAVAESRRMLEAAGFSQLREDQPWSLRPNQKAFVTRNGTTMFAFAMGGKWKPGNGFSIVGAHTDSPCLRLKPVSLRDGAGELQQCGVETYGGGLWYSWFDRDLTVAGRVIVRGGGSGSSDSSRLTERLVNLEAPLFKVPSLAIHLNRSVNDEGFAPNKENHLAPILCRKLASDAAGSEPEAAQQQRHPAGLLSRVANNLGCQPNDILDWDLYLADTQPAGVTGLNGDFISSPRLDNLLSCYAALTALIEAPGLENDTNCRVVCLYDHEEIGSESAQGAGSALTLHFLKRLCSGADFETAVPKSLLVSADVAHAVHPNYEEKHERKHRPTLFGGVVIKENVNQRYATNCVTSSLLRECLRLTDPAAEMQDFVIRQDMACGSTIGPILAAKIGLPTIDVGSPIFGMHSIRETGAAVAPGQCVQLFSAFFSHFPALREAMETQ